MSNILDRPNSSVDSDTHSIASNMSSYADIAAKGPSQTDEEKVPHALPEIEHEESAPGVTVIDPLNEHNPATNVSYADQQLQAERAEAAKREAESKANELSKEARDFMESATASEAKLTGGSSSQAKKDFDQTASKAKKDFDQTASKAKKDFEQTADKAEKKFNEVKGKVVDEYEHNIKPNVEKGLEKGKKEGKKAEQWADKNKGNPVILGNAVVVALLSGILGVGAYRMHKTNSLTWNVVGAWAGALGAFAIGDYYVSQYFFKKYPTKD